MNFFRNLTLNKTVIMGYNTWASLDFKKLPNRNNIVISSKLHVDGNYDVLYHDVETAMINHFDEELIEKHCEYFIYNYKDEEYLLEQIKDLVSFIKFQKDKTNEN